MKVTYVDHMGSDLSIVNAARVSFGKQSNWKETPDGFYLKDYVLHERDKSLIQFLARGCTSGDWESALNAIEERAFTASYHGDKFARRDFEDLIRNIKNMPDHWTPFGHTAITLHIKAPIFVARQLGKHQVGLVWNEVSRRYVKDDIELYYPDFWRGTVENIKQGSSDKAVTVNTYGSGVCVRCGDDVPRKSVGPRGKWCSETCRASYRKENDPDFRINSAKYNAKKRGVPFDLVRGDVVWVTHCPILGVELDYSSAKGRNSDDSPSIDRIDASKGYTKDNVWVISNKANRMKNDGSREDLVKFARSILLHFNGQSVPEDGTIEAACKHMVAYYNSLLDDGVAPEQARMVLPQNLMTEWYWTGNLYSFANIYIQRIDSHAQKETQEVAKQIGDIIAPLFPVSWEALTT